MHAVPSRHHRLAVQADPGVAPPCHALMHEHTNHRVEQVTTPRCHGRDLVSGSPAALTCRWARPRRASGPPVAADWEAHPCPAPVQVESRSEALRPGKAQQACQLVAAWSDGPSVPNILHTGCGRGRHSSSHVRCGEHDASYLLACRGGHDWHKTWAREPWHGRRPVMSGIAKEEGTWTHCRALTPTASSVSNPNSRARRDSSPRHLTWCIEASMRSTFQRLYDG